MLAVKLKSTEHEVVLLKKKRGAPYVNAEYIHEYPLKKNPSKELSIWTATMFTLN